MRELLKVFRSSLFDSRRSVDAFKSTSSRSSICLGRTE
ncbi:hypothetical protein LG3211_3636 [Lysobacter gummosus]|nr:hypothetical protein LG3211_3636 [Lysobacter gummosus]